MITRHLSLDVFRTGGLGVGRFMQARRALSSPLTLFTQIILTNWIQPNHEAEGKGQGEWEAQVEAEILSTPKNGGGRMWETAHDVKYPLFSMIYHQYHEQNLHAHPSTIYITHRAQSPCILLS